MKLDIITPEQIYFSGEVSSVTLPGVQGAFTILENHAPIISALGKGKIVYQKDNSEVEISVISGFAEGHDNIITVSIEEIGNE